MKTILVPTDFSAYAETALKYAIALAKEQNANIVLLNAYNTDYSNAYVSFDIIAEESARARAEAETRLKSEIRKLKHGGKVKIEPVSAKNFVVDAVLAAIAEMHIDLVVMGTKGESGYSETLFGSNTAKVIEKADCPVIAVPKETVFKPISRITFATTYHHSDIKDLEVLVKIAGPVKAHITILHISDGLMSADEEKERLKTFKTEVKEKISYEHISYHVQKGDIVEEDLEEYIAQGNTDLLVMSTHHRGFFEKIFGKSVTKNMALQTSIPLMVFHRTSKSSVTVF